MLDHHTRVRHISWFGVGVELPVPLSPLIFASYSCFLFLFPLVFFSFEVLFDNCKCRSWCRPDDLVSSYTKSGTVLMYFSSFNVNLL